jgi:membrane AbrB-like protein
VILNLAETLAIAAVGGTIFGLSGFPAGWLSGSMLFVAIAAIAGRPAHMPPLLAAVIFIVIGISLGSVATPETMRGITTWPVSIAVLIVGLLCTNYAVAAYLRRVHGWDGKSAALAGSPGAMSQTIILANQYKADVRGVAIVQSVRVVILAVAMPAALSSLGLVSPAQIAFPAQDVANPALEFVILVGVSTAAALILERLKFRGGLMFGAMFASAVLHGSGLVHAVLPWWIASVTMIGLGAITGARFANTGVQLMLRYLGAALGSFLIAVTVAWSFALALITFGSFRAADVIVSFAPGALDVMMILALAMHIDPIYVGAHHLTRVLAITLWLPLVLRTAGGRK